MRASQLAGVIEMARGIMGGNYVLLLLLLLYDGDTLRLTLTWIDYLGPSIYSYTPHSPLPWYTLIVKSQVISVAVAGDIIRTRIVFYIRLTNR